MSEYRINQKENNITIKSNNDDFYVFYNISLSNTHCPFCLSQHPGFNYNKDSLYDLSKLCHKQNKFRYGFLWLKKCKLDNKHYHYKCNSCKSKIIIINES